MTQKVATNVGAPSQVEYEEKLVQALAQLLASAWRPQHNTPVGSQEIG